MQCFSMQVLFYVSLSLDLYFRVDIWCVDGTRHHAEFNSIKVQSEAANYKIYIGSLSSSNMGVGGIQIPREFSTNDR